MARQAPVAETTDYDFARTIYAELINEAFKVTAPVFPASGMLVSLKDTNVALICSEAKNVGAEQRLLSAIHTYAKQLPHPVVAIAVVKAHLPSESYRKGKKKSLGVDVIDPPGVVAYLRDWEDTIEDADEPKPEPKPRTSPASHSWSNATAIITITRSLAIQLDARIDALKQEKPNSDEKIAARDAALSDYQLLRARVAQLEKAVAQLKLPNPKTAPTTKAGASLGSTVQKWWAKSGPKVLDKSTDVGIVVTCASLLALLGVDPTWAAGVSAFVVTGKAPRGLFKTPTGH